MEWRIRRGLLLMGLISAIMAVVITVSAFYNMFRTQVEKDVQLTAQTVAVAYDSMRSIYDVSHYAKDNLRITLINPRGSVIYESGDDAEAMKNQAQLPEVAEAMLSGSGQSVRPAEKTDENQYYYALRLHDGNILRAGISTSNMFMMFIGAYSNLVIIEALVLIALSAASAVLVTRRMVRPLKQLAANIDNVDPDRRGEGLYRELAPFVREIQQHRREKDRIAEERLSLAGRWHDYVIDISHELKTPLTSISGYAEVLKDAAVDPETAQRFADVIYREACRMRTLISDVIFQAEMESDTPDMREPLELMDVARECVEALTLHAESYGVTLSLAGKSCVLNADREQMDSIFVNLIDNAIRYNRPGGTVEVYVADGTVRVTDDGIGIPTEHLTHLFERFYRVERSRSRDTGGTGLGLPIVQTIAERYGARVEVESAPDKGTRVTVCFTAADGSFPENPPAIRDGHKRFI